MKIGLLTTHYAVNYGAVLQAVCRKINNIGYDLEIMDIILIYLTILKTNVEFNKQKISFVFIQIELFV